MSSLADDRLVIPRLKGIIGVPLSTTNNFEYLSTDLRVLDENYKKKQAIPAILGSWNNISSIAYYHDRLLLRQIFL